MDAIESIEPVHFEESVWRIVKEGRNPIQGSRSGGRWDDGTFDVLYTSMADKGALEEMRFHLMRGQPVMPSKIKYKLFEIDLSLKKSLKLLDLDALQGLGLDISHYGRLSYQQKADEYPRSQDIGEIAHFLDYDGLVVPSARHDCLNVIAFCDQLSPEAMEIKEDHGIVIWAAA